MPFGIDNSGNLEVLTETVGTLDLRSRKTNRSGAAKKAASKARLAEVLIWGLCRRTTSTGAP